MLYAASNIVSIQVSVPCRQLSRLEGSGQDKIVGYYEKMMVTMAESEDKKPGFVGVAQLIW